MLYPVLKGHFFETLAFLEAYESPATDFTFQRNCLNLITGSGTTLRTRGDKLDPSLFIDGNGPAAAFIMTPRQDQADLARAVPNPPVPDPITQLLVSRISQPAATVETLIPGVGITVYNYLAKNKYPYDYQGKALFEYDPDADGPQ